MEGHAWRGRAESSQGPKKGGEGRKAAGGRVTGKDWSPERQRVGRGVRKAVMHWGAVGVVDSGLKGRGAWRVYAGKLPLEPLLINLQLCPHKAFSRVRVRKGDRE